MKTHTFASFDGQTWAQCSSHSHLQMQEETIDLLRTIFLPSFWCKRFPASTFLYCQSRRMQEKILTGNLPLLSWWCLKSVPVYIVHNVEIFVLEPWITVVFLSQAEASSTSLDMSPVRLKFHCLQCAGGPISPHSEVKKRELGSCLPWARLSPYSSAMLPAVVFD